MREKVQTGIVWALPRWMIYWACVRIAVYKNDGNPAERSCGDALKQWGYK